MTQQADEIKIVDIEKELSKLCDANKSIRAGLFNLIVYSSEPRRHAHLQEIVQSIIKKFPCRILFIQKNNSVNDNHLRVTVSYEVVKKGTDSIACDYILIDVSQHLLGRVPFLVTPHLIPDLPIYLLWGQNPTTEEVLLPHFMPFASRLIFDSDCAEDLPKFSKKILKFMAARPDIDIIDLTWVRMKGWRTVLAQVFESPTALQQLRLNKGVKICYNNKAAEHSQHRELQGLYLTAWLVCQMEWKWISCEHSNGVINTICSNGTNEFSITLSPETREDANSGAIVKVEVASNDDCFFFMSLMEKLSKVVVHISSVETCELPFNLSVSGQKRGTINITDLVFSPTSPHYRNMIELLENKDNSNPVEWG